MNYQRIDYYSHISWFIQVNLWVISHYSNTKIHLSFSHIFIFLLCFKQLFGMNNIFVILSYYEKIIHIYCKGQLSNNDFIIGKNSWISEKIYKVNEFKEFFKRNLSFISTLIGFLNTWKNLYIILNQGLVKVRDLKINNLISFFS